MDNLSIILSLCIGNFVAWLMALYTERGAYMMLWNMLFGTIGALLCALAIARLAPALAVVGLVVAGPVCAILAIHAGHALRRRLGGRPTQ